MNVLLRFGLLALSLVALPSCGGGTPQQPDNPTPDPGTSKFPLIKIAPSIVSSGFMDSSFVNGDQVGLFVVNYNGTAPGSLAISGNHADNVCFTYSGSWTSSSQKYWKDETTKADLYLYYPYMNLNSVTEAAFEVKTNQDTSQSLRASDFILGKATNLTPTSSAVTVKMNHLMSQVDIELLPGKGFTAETLAATSLSVKLNGLKVQSAINLATAEVKATGSEASVITLRDNNLLHAIVVPQTVEGTNLITVTIDDKETTFSQKTTFESGKVHKFTITVDKTSNGINVNINPWGDGGEFGGTAV